MDKLGKTMTHAKKKITLEQIEDRMVDPTIIRQMVRGYFERVSIPQVHIEKHVLTISCVDSRLPPAHVLSHEHGQAYAVQTVANVVPSLDMERPYDEQLIQVAAALEYAVIHKGINEIIIMGHTDCGGAEARLLQDPTLPNVNGWMNHVCIDGLHTPSTELRAALKLSPFYYESGRRESERACLRTSVENIKEMPFIKEAIAKTRLSIAGVMCDIQNRNLEISYGNRSARGAVSDLVRRFKQFKSDVWGPNGCMHELDVNGQNPKALILTGISPYVAPENVFGIKPGDSFIHRSIGGHYHHDKTPGAIAATIEFAVKVKGIKSFVIVGHKNDVNRDYAEGIMDKYPLVTAFMEQSTPQIREWRDSGMNVDRLHELSQISTYFNVLKHPAVKQAIKNEKLSVASIFVDHEEGTMQFYDPISSEFLGVIPPAL